MAAAIDSIRIATSLKYCEIDSMDTLNGVTIEEIEKRARPGSAADSGFLGKDESFRKVLKEDWETVHSLTLLGLVPTTFLVSLALTKCKIGSILEGQ